MKEVWFCTHEDYTIYGSGATAKAAFTQLQEYVFSEDSIRVTVEDCVFYKAQQVKVRSEFDIVEVEGGENE